MRHSSVLADRSSLAAYRQPQTASDPAHQLCVIPLASQHQPGLTRRSLPRPHAKQARTTGLPPPPKSLRHRHSANRSSQSLLRRFVRFPPSNALGRSTLILTGIIFSSLRDRLILLKDQYDLQTLLMDLVDASAIHEDVSPFSPLLPRARTDEIPHYRTSSNQRTGSFPRPSSASTGKLLSSLLREDRTNAVVNAGTSSTSKSSRSRIAGEGNAGRASCR